MQATPRTSSRRRQSRRTGRRRAQAQRRTRSTRTARASSSARSPEHRQPATLALVLKLVQAPAAEPAHGHELSSAQRALVLSHAPSIGIDEEGQPCSDRAHVTLFDDARARSRDVGDLESIAHRILNRLTAGQEVRNIPSPSENIQDLFHFYPIL